MPAARQTRAFAEPKSAAIGTVFPGYRWPGSGHVGGGARTQNHDCFSAFPPHSVIWAGTGGWNGRTTRPQTTPGRAQGGPQHIPNASITDGLGASRTAQHRHTHDGDVARRAAALSLMRAISAQALSPHGRFVFFAPALCFVGPATGDEGISCCCAGQPSPHDNEAGERVLKPRS